MHAQLFCIYMYIMLCDHAKCCTPLRSLDVLPTAWQAKHGFSIGEWHVCLRRTAVRARMRGVLKHPEAGALPWYSI